MIVGSGKRIFENGAKPSALRLVNSKVSTTGVIMSTYVPDGEIVFGLLGEEIEPSAKRID